ncbi:restriction system-associated AAA family ATPase [Aquimarina algiphila]|uniref:restriction system-associated AAA family ATPase n=1 Tax=Aquimarina algiphila TaxID=2047982 RepID=UPI00232B5CCB|nr:restriction system-associated AAA family ATPase [Aquimarina algiphila]
MKLLRLKINNAKGFRSLKKGFEIYFLRDFDYTKTDDFNPYLLAGRNGSGKSNVLEALAEIFYHLDGMYLNNKPEYFIKKFDPNTSRVNAYELEYFTYLDTEFFPEADPEIVAQIRIIKKYNNRPFITIRNLDDFEKEYNELSRQQIKSLLPRYVIGYASGHNETLSIPFFKSRLLQYDEYYSNLESQEFTDPSPESSLIFLDEQFSQAIMLTCLLMFDDPETDTHSSVLEPFREYVKLEAIDSFRLILRTDTEVLVTDINTTDNATEFADTPIPLIENLHLSDEGKTETIRTRSYIEKLKRCATCWDEYQQDEYDELYFDDSFDDSFANGKSAKANEYIIFDFKVDNATKMAFQLHFENDPLKLFEFFQLGIILNNYVISTKNKENAYQSVNPFINQDIAQVPIEEDRILRFKNVLIKKTDIDKTIYTKSLSDGEHQFIHTLGLSLLFRNTKSLFLLDEPETHFNPDWKAKYISSLRNCFNQEQDENKTSLKNKLPLRDMLITTHSPFLISDTDMKYVHVFKKNEKTLKVDEVIRPEFQTFGTSINKIGIRIFKMPNTIGEYAQARLKELRSELPMMKTDTQKEDLIERIQKELGESVERLIVINEIVDSMNKK